jgi:hypothetical protein
MAEMDDTLQALNRLERTINEQRDLLLQAHGVLACVQDVLLHADGKEAVSCAQATQVAADLIDKSAEELDSVRIRPLLDVLAPSSEKVDESRVFYLT